MQLPGPVGPAWNLRLFRLVGLVFFLTPCTLVLIFLGMGMFAEAAACATSAIIFGCNWAGARHYTRLLEKWGRRPGYGRRGSA